eukprot:Nk52_evm60s212 gene=Nk52_evmTU60s212
MTSTYLEQYLASMESIPFEIQRNFTLIREVDSHSNCLLGSIEEKSKTLANDLKDKSKEERMGVLKDVQKEYAQAVQFCSAKVELAEKIYELLDGHVKKLDGAFARYKADPNNEEPDPYEEAINDWKKFQKQMKLEMEEEEAAREEAARKGKVLYLSRPENPGKKKQKQISLDDLNMGFRSNMDSTPPKASAKETTKNKKKTQATSSAAKKAKTTKKVEKQKTPKKQKAKLNTTIQIPQPQDPDEQRYCICDQISYGEMIGCDNPDCPTEWFHFQCIGLTTKPKGKWFCPGCSERMKKKK